MRSSFSSPRRYVVETLHHSTKHPFRVTLSSNALLFLLLIVILIMPHPILSQPKPSHSSEFNFASSDVGAKIISASPDAVSVSRILNEDHDRYMLIPKANAMESFFFVVELSEVISMRRIAVANFEYYSCSMKTFKLYGRVKENESWDNLGVFEADNSKSVQTFELDEPKLVRYIMLNVTSIYSGSDSFYCTMSVLRVHGETLYQDLVNLMNPDDSDHVPDDTPLLDVESGTRIEGNPPPVGVEVPEGHKPDASHSTDGEDELLARVRDIAQEDAPITIPDIESSSQNSGEDAGQEPIVDPELLERLVDRSVIDKISLEDDALEDLEEEEKNADVVKDSPEADTKEELEGDNVERKENSSVSQDLGVPSDHDVISPPEEVLPSAEVVDKVVDQESSGEKNIPSGAERNETIESPSDSPHQQDTPQETPDSSPENILPDFMPPIGSTEPHRNDSTPTADEEQKVVEPSLDSDTGAVDEPAASDPTESQNATSTGDSVVKTNETSVTPNETETLPPTPASLTSPAKTPTTTSEETVPVETQTPPQIPSNPDSSNTTQNETDTASIPPSTSANVTDSNNTTENDLGSLVSLKDATPLEITEEADRERNPKKPVKQYSSDEATLTPENDKKNETPPSEIPKKPIESQKAQPQQNETQSTLTASTPPTTAQSADTASVQPPRTDQPPSTHRKPFSPKIGKGGRENILKSMLSTIQNVGAETNQLTKQMRSVKEQYKEAFQKITSVLAQKSDEINVLAESILTLRKKNKRYRSECKEADEALRAQLKVDLERELTLKIYNKIEHRVYEQVETFKKQLRDEYETKFTKLQYATLLAVMLAIVINIYVIGMCTGSSTERDNSVNTMEGKKQTQKAIASTSTTTTTVIGETTKSTDMASAIPPLHRRTRSYSHTMDSFIDDWNSDEDERHESQDGPTSVQGGASK